eukprot:7369788-Lingulodinium_polyedra.AAC.1
MWAFGGMYGGVVASVPEQCVGGGTHANVALQITHRPEAAARASDDTPVGNQSSSNVDSPVGQ